MLCDTLLPSQLVPSTCMLCFIACRSSAETYKPALQVPIDTAFAWLRNLIVIRRCRNRTATNFWSLILVRKK